MHTGTIGENTFYKWGLAFIYGYMGVGKIALNIILLHYYCEFITFDYFNIPLPSYYIFNTLHSCPEPKQIIPEKPPKILTLFRSLMF